MADWHALFQSPGKLLDEIDHSLLRLPAPNLVERLEKANGACGLQDRENAFGAPKSKIGAGVGFAAEEERNWRIEGLANLFQPACADATSAVLVFLDLLKSHPDPNCQLGLR